jgi:lipoprotein-anchoring transpeptidase ErfK/SrfK
MLPLPYVTRRRFIGSTLAASVLLAAPALASKRPKDWALTEAQLPTMVRVKNKFAPGEIHVDPNTYSLYWTLPKGKAIRYTVGVGRGDLYIPGIFKVGAKKEWPSWTPTKEMIARSPGHYAQFADGMPGGPTNPLGARALYLFDDVRGDTFLRIHGTPEPWTIGSAVSNGCVRLVNEHIAALYDTVPMGSRVVLYGKKSQA